MGFELEHFVQRDGAYDFDPLLLKLGGILGINEIPKDRPIFNDADTIAELTRKIKLGGVVTPQSVAEEYSYPLLYVNQVLWNKIERANFEKS